MAKEKANSPRLTPIPKAQAAKGPPTNKGRRPTSAAAAVGDSAPDLSRIVEGLRPLAVLIGDLQFDPINARTHDETNLQAIRGSLTVYGQRKPVVVNRRTGAVESGNGTLAAALSLGWTYLAAVYVDDDPATATGFAIADNRTAELADWDKDILGKLLADIHTGCDERLDQMISDLAEVEKLIPKDSEPDEQEDAEDDADEVPAAIQCPHCGHVFTAGPAQQPSC